MKEFNKWIKITKDTINPGDVVAWVNWRAGANAAWKAALEWLSNSCWCGGDINSFGEWKDCEFIAEIQKELKDD